MVSSSNNRVVVMSTVEGVTASFRAEPTPRQPTQQPDGVSETEVQRRVDAARQEGQKVGEETGRTQAELEQRAPRWADALDADADFAARPIVRGVTHSRDDGRNINRGDNYPISKSAPSISGFTGDARARDVVTHEDTLYLYTNIGSPNRRAFWNGMSSYGLDS